MKRTTFLALFTAIFALFLISACGGEEDGSDLDCTLNASLISVTTEINGDPNDQYHGYYVKVDGSSGAVAPLTPVSMSFYDTLAGITVNDSSTSNEDGSFSLIWTCNSILPKYVEIKVLASHCNSVAIPISN